MSIKIGGRIVSPAFPVVSSAAPTSEELSFQQSLEAYMVESVPLESTEGIQRRERALNRIGQLAREWICRVCQKKGLPPDVVDNAGGQLFTSGSYRLGVHEPGADIDTILVAPNMCSRIDFFGEVMQDGETRDPDSLAERIRRHPDVTNFVPVEGAAVPILTFDFEGVNIDLLFATLNTASVPPSLDIDNDAVLDGVDSATEKSLNGPRVTNLIAALVSGTPERYQTFLTVVRCVRKWCKARGLYSNKMGYWGGVNINISVALCVQLYPMDCPASLLRKFFLVMKTWRWPNPIMLTKPHDAGYGLTVWNAQHSHRQIAPIITPAYPAMNSTLSISRQTLQIMHEEFCRGHAIVDKLWKQNQENPGCDLDWSELFQPSDFFIAFPQYLSLCIVGPTQADAQAWAGFVESRLRKLVSDMLGRSLPLSKIQLWPKKIEACVADKGALLTKAQRENSITYFCGFQVDKLRMRGSQLNVEMQLNNFREWELSKFQPLVPGMDLVTKPFRVKELPRVCFHTMGLTKEEAMKRRRTLRDADPRRQEAKRLIKLKELKEQKEALERKAQEGKEKLEQNRKRKHDGTKAEEEEEGDLHRTTKKLFQQPQEVPSSALNNEEAKILGNPVSSTENVKSWERKHERTKGEEEEEEGFQQPTKELSQQPQEMPSFTIDNEETKILENVFDTIQDEGKTREEAEADRRKLLAGEMLMEGGDLSDDEEDYGYTGDGARRSLAAWRQKERKTESKKALPLSKEESDLLAKIGCPFVSDDETRVIGGSTNHLWRFPVKAGLKSALILFNTEFDISDLDANGFLIDKGDEDFTPSLKWVGRKAGFEFKLGERGLGYYRTGKKVVVPSNTAY